MMKRVNLSQELASIHHPLRVIYISSYVPRKCGIATFTKDLTSAINDLNPHALAEIVAMVDDNEYDYPWEVKFRIGQRNSADYAAAEQYINRSSADVVNIQHEFGLYGGTQGDYILALLENIKKPIVSNFHTVLPNPDEHQKHVMKRIIKRSDAVVAMTEGTRQVLERVYGCPHRKTVVIPHGVPDFSFNHIAKHRQSLGIEAEPMILSSGLISPSKGLEHAVEAMAPVVQEFPNAKFYIIGQTHPHVIHETGETYREKLIHKAKELGIADNVQFINRYLDLAELKTFYQAADFFITPHLDLQQAMSGTLSYALGAGKACISTAYNYAKEVLGDGAGLLVDVGNSEQIARHIIDYWKDKAAYQALRRRAYRKGRLMTWPNIGQQYLNLFRLVVEGGEAYQKPANVFAAAHR